MSKQHITIDYIYLTEANKEYDGDAIIGLLEHNKDVINAQLEGAGESASIQLDVEVKPRLPSVNGAGSSGVSSLSQSWSLDVIVNKDNS